MHTEIRSRPLRTVVVWISTCCESLLQQPEDNDHTLG